MQAEESEGTLSADQVQEDNALETVIAQEIGTTYKAVKKAPYPSTPLSMPAKFDTVLVHYSAAVKDTGAMGYRAACVHTFFRLPPHFNHPHLLACVEWYSDLRAAPAVGTEISFPCLAIRPKHVTLPKRATQNHPSSLAVAIVQSSDNMASKVVPAFLGPLIATVLEEWLGQCDDGFAIHAATKAEKTPALEVPTKIRITGSQLQEPTMTAWWSSGRKEFLKLVTWESFEKKIRERFMPKGYKLLALRSFFLSRNAVGETIIPANIYKYQLLFHAHHILLLRIMAMPDLNIEAIDFDDLVALMSMQWESLIAEGVSGHPSARPAQTPSPTPAGRIPTPSGTASPTMLQPSVQPLTHADQTHLTNLEGCWKCSLGIPPGHDFVSVKKEVASYSMLHDDEDQPDPAPRQYVGFVMGGFQDDGEDQPELEIAQCYRDDDTDESGSDGL
ncbi:hypothetical protein M422DRAFT_272597 [Sphaerobolus stellatus SS14]|uniref:Uncharacterized protein n=1 Tax=Sphaerobolus stellatus (strain SS14) TaxID=990650 RepID=A0A0C9ULN8_SPHS4|nr:hypothetical protein M422DRAFT_272597 [Sphaerobolus stellatus SS14]